MLPRHARCVLFRLRCNGLKSSVKLLSLEDWQNRESFLQRLRTLVPRHCSSLSAMSSYGHLVLLALWQISVSLRPLVQVSGSCPASGAPWSSAMPPSIGRGRITAATTTISWKKTFLVKTLPNAMVFNLFSIGKPLLYFYKCHGIPVTES